ncbi:MAG: hypothetical protein Q8R18_02570 [bacterium]|nr:hypothetical protein [bacterium]
MVKNKIIKKLGVLIMMIVLLSSVFSVAFVQAGAMNQGWNFLITGYAIDDVEESGGVEIDTSLYSGSAGLTPDSPFYFVDTLFDRFSSSEDLAQEKLGEMGVMISEGSYSDAGVAAKYYSNAALKLQSDVGTFENNDEFFVDQRYVYGQDAYIGYLKLQLVEGVDSGYLSQELAAETGIDGVHENVIALKTGLIETRDSYIVTYAEQQGVSIIDADLALQESEADAGLDVYHEAELAQSLPNAGEAFIEVEQELQSLLASSDVSVEQEIAIEELLQEVELHLEEAAGAYESGFLGDALGELADAENLLFLADRILDEGIDSVPVEEIELVVEEEETEREEETNREHGEYDLYLEDLLERYPERAENIQREAGRMQRVNDLNELYQGQYGDLYADLVTEGRTDAEAAQLMGQRWDNLYLEIYGEPNTPPGFYEDDFQDEEDDLEVIPVRRIDYESQAERANELTSQISEELKTEYQQLIDEGLDEHDANMEIGKFWDQRYLELYGEPYYPSGMGDIEGGVVSIDDGSVLLDEEELDSKEMGGFFLDEKYYDFATGNTYKFIENGYTYTDFLGEEHEFLYDEGFVPSEEIEGFQDGTEEYEYTIIENGQELTYSYTVTGYSITDEEGEVVDSGVYDEGTYETVGGDAEVVIDTFGFEIDPVEGDTILFEYSPEFENYVSVEGQVYIPSQGAAYHTRAVDYKNGVYEYKSGDGAWAYDPAAGVWTSTNGEVYTPYVMNVAPAGYESYGRYESESGKTWNYDNREWRSDKGDKWAYYSDEGSWRNSDTGIAYNPGLSYQTYKYNGADSSARGNYESYTSYGGVTWSFDKETNAWSSSEGGSYYVPDYSSYNMGYKSAEETGGNTAGYSYSYYGYQTNYAAGSSSGMGSGATWNYDSATGGWQSSTGETYYTPVSTNYYSPSYTSGSTTAGTGTADSKGNIWNYDSSIGQWVSPTGEAYTPTYSTYSSGSYSGGGGYDSSGNYVGGEYGGYTTGGSYVGGESYTYDSSTGTYTTTAAGGGTGSTAYGSPAQSGGYPSGSYSTSGDSGTSYSSGSYSTSSSGGDSGGSSSSSGGDSSSSYSAPTGYVSLNLYRRF